jgi:hypothetical protein
MNTLIRFVLGFALLLLPIQNNNAQNVQFRYHYSIEVPNRSQVTLRQTAGWLVANGFDVAGVSLDQGRIDVITDDAGIKALQARGLRGYLQTSSGCRRQTISSGCALLQSRKKSKPS